MTQDDIFLAEGDNWFKRNAPHLKIKSDDPILSFFERHNFKPQRILDIGGSTGYRVAALAKKLGAKGFVIEPGAAAVKTGKKDFPNINIRRGSAHDLSAYKDNFFDAIIVNFVLHWVDRSELLKTISEIDRVLADGGLLLIGDFNPHEPHKVKYHHLPDREVYTYKQAYGKIFTVSNLYTEIFAEEFLHDPSEGLTDRNLCRFSVLQKRQQFNYPTHV